MKITVTADDIKNGSPRKPASCPITLALKRASPRVLSVEPFYAWIEHPATNLSQLFYLPESAQSFIEDFDNGKPVQPFEFNLFF